MSATGVWVVGAVPDRTAVSLPGEYVHLVAEEDVRKPDGFAQTLAWWRGGCDDEPFFVRGGNDLEVLSSTATGRRFADFVHGANPDTAATGAIRDASRALMPAEGADGVFCAVVRRASPAAALHYGLGAAAAALLPGWFGDFLLTADGVRAALPDAERALGIEGERRARVLRRIGDWLTGMGDAPQFTAEDLLDGPLGVLRHAAGAGLGVAAFSRWS
ncbi:hypothetical protein [Streptomyces broussonetiae]|uniref:Uncharacterized protein n=1 Tax=Streptomyces broussonetiae TaxID=2686304 RepID=A0A6I6N2G5_9ACTN|nr:hypothetical protein [Streptomyces broussonetiae]QHA05702.1 hypothetical protein GQF42_22605 [Streptomyces broussonetiae]